jgi:hypothetical protein
VVDRVDKLAALQMWDTSDKDVWFSGVKHHYWQHTAGRVFNNYGTDTVENYNQESGYTRGGITYNFNLDGYRCDPLGKSPVVFLGCSYTMGIGLPVVDVWAYRVATTLGIPYINLAYQGGSFSYWLRTVLKARELVRSARYVVLLYPYSWRVELVQDGRIRVWTEGGVHSGLFFGKEQDRLYAYEQYRTQEQDEFETIKNLRTLQALVYPATLVHAYWCYNNYPSLWFFDQVGAIGERLDARQFNGHTRHQALATKARDGLHPGKQFHVEFAEEVLGFLTRT